MQHIFIKTFEVAHGETMYQVAVLRGNKDENDSSVTILSLMSPGKTAVSDLNFSDVPARDKFFLEYDQSKADKFILDDVFGTV
jgi:hypothetical protein